VAKGELKPLPALKDNCPTGWCDEQNGQFAAPKGWGSQGKESGSPKSGPGRK